MDLNVHLWRSQSHRDLNGPQCPFMAVPPHPKWTSMSISGGSNRILLDLNVHKVLATAATAAAATVSQELWTSGGALFQRAQEPNIPFGESLTSTCELAELAAECSPKHLSHHGADQHDGHCISTLPLHQDYFSDVANSFSSSMFYRSVPPFCLTLHRIT